MEDRIYARKIKKTEQVRKGAIYYWFRNEKKELICIISYGTLLLKTLTVFLYTATNHRFIGELERTCKPLDTTGAKYYVCA